MKNLFLIKLALIFFVSGVLITLCGLPFKNTAVLSVGGLLAGYCTTITLIVLHKKDPTLFEGLITCVLSASKVILGLLAAILLGLLHHSPQVPELLNTNTKIALIEVAIGCDIILSIYLLLRGWRLAVFPGTSQR